MQSEELTDESAEESAAELFDGGAPYECENSESVDSSDSSSVKREAGEEAMVDKPKRKAKKKPKGKIEEKPPEETEEKKPDKPPEETEEEKQRRKCRELNDLCVVMSHRIEGYLQGDIEFESLVSALQAAAEECENYEKIAPRRRRSGKLKRRSRRRLKKLGKDIRRKRQDLNVFCFYHSINLRLLESPRAYACMLCKDKQPVTGEDGEEYCRLRQEELDGEQTE